MSLAFTFVDLLTVAIVVVSTAYAIYRGFVAETLLILAPAIAALASLYVGPFVAPLLRGMFGAYILAQIVGYALVFVAVFIPISFASHRFSQNVKDSAMGPLDRTLGFAFGIVRGLAIIGLGYLIFTAIIPTHRQPESVRDARLLPLIQGSSEVILALVPDHGHSRDAGETRDSGRGQADSNDIRPMPKPDSNSAPRDHKSYGASDRRALDSLIQRTGNGDNGQP